MKQFILNIHRFRTGGHWKYILGVRSTLGIYSRSQEYIGNIFLESGVHWEYILGVRSTLGIYSRSQDYIGNMF